jgi:hypothetical protein
MADTRAMKVRRHFLCDFCQPTDSGKTNAFGIFDFFVAASLPHVAPPFFTYVDLVPETPEEAEDGFKVQFRADIVNLRDGAALSSVSGEAAITGAKYKFAPPTLGFMIQWAGIAFPETGDYEVRVFVGEALAGSFEFKVGPSN